MKATRVIEMLVLGALVAVIAGAVTTANAAVFDPFERLTPSESVAVETGGGEIPWATVEPFLMGNDAGYIERLLPSESGEIETGGGEVPVEMMRHTDFNHDTVKIELLLPSDY